MTELSVARYNKPRVYAKSPLNPCIIIIIILTLQSLLKLSLFQKRPPLYLQ
jgi:hypothetical protein